MPNITSKKDNQFLAGAIYAICREECLNNPTKPDTDAISRRLSLIIGHFVEVCQETDKVLGITGDRFSYQYLLESLQKRNMLLEEGA